MYRHGKIRMFVTLAVVFMFLIIVCSLASAEEKGNIAISGFVKDGNTPVQGVTMTALAWQFPANWYPIATTTTSSSGYYSLSISTTIGLFKVVPTKPGYYFGPIDRQYHGSVGNQSNQNYVVLSLRQGPTMEGLSLSSSDWGDYNNDGLLDLAVCGQLSNGQRVLRVYRAVLSAGGGISFVQALSMSGPTSGKVAWVDYNNDGDLDLAVTGYGIGNYYVKMYRNLNGSFSFNSAASISSPKAMNVSTFAWGDFDHDGDVDVAIACELRDSWGQYLKIFKNNAGSFLYSQDLLTSTSTGGIGLAFASLAWGDYDRDGDLDLAVCGRTYKWTNPSYGWGSLTAIFNYNGQNGLFSKANISTLINVEEGSIAWADFDNDGDLDLAVAGWNRDANKARFCAYRNDLQPGGPYNEFTLVADFPGFKQSTLTVGDVNADGKIDIAVQGKLQDGTPTTRVYKNRGNFWFEDAQTQLPGVYNGSIAFADYDDDGRLDLVSTGVLASNGRICNAYKNLRLFEAGNTAPQAPAQLVQTINTGDNSVKLQWSQGSDAQTNFQGLSYNLCVGTNPTSCDIVSPLSQADGERQVAAVGSIAHKTEPLNYWHLNGLQGGAAYYWKVQAIDPGLTGSAFSAQKSFYLPSKGKIGK